VAIFFIGDDALFGRYWGAGATITACTSKPAITKASNTASTRNYSASSRGSGRAQGAAGFVPTLMSSAHFVADQRFAAAIRDFAARESRGVDRYAAAVSEHVPYHRAPDEELQL